MKFIGTALALALFQARQGSAQNAKVAYPTMALLQQYLMHRDVEILSRGLRPRNQSPAMPKSSSSRAHLDAVHLAILHTGSRKRTASRCARSSWERPTLVLALALFFWRVSSGNSSRARGCSFLAGQASGISAQTRISADLRGPLALHFAPTCGPASLLGQCFMGNRASWFAL